MIASVYDAPTNIAGYDPFRDADGYYFDPIEAERRVKFFGLAIKKFGLQQWQKDIVATLFGWKRISDNLRRYREAFIFVPRKNGKTSLTAGITLCAFALEKLREAQYYCAAFDLDQADLLFSIASGMVRDCPALSDQCTIRPSRKRIIKGRSFLRAIPADAEGAYGSEPAFVAGDELHLWKTRKLKDTLHTGTAALSEPLEVYITTAGFEFESICGEVYTHAAKVRDGIISDPAFFPVIYEAPKDADWKVEETWKAANPNYGVSVRKEYMEAECRKAIENPNYENTFKREHLNVWTEQKTRWLKMDDWRKCSITQDRLIERCVLAD